MKKIIKNISDSDLNEIGKDISKWLNECILDENSKLFEIQSKINKQYNVNYSIQATEQLVLYEILERYINTNKSKDTKKQ